MKILLTSDWPVSAINGVAVSIKNLYHELVRLGHQVRVLSLSDRSCFYKDNDFYYIKSFELSIYPNARATTSFHNPYVRELIRWRPDIIHSQCEFFTFSIANIIAERCKAPIVHTYHTVYDHYTSYIRKNERILVPALKKLIRIRLADADLIVAPTAKTYRSLKAITNTKIVIMATGIDLAMYDRPVSEDKKLEIREKYKIAKDKRILLTLGRVSQEKNIDESIVNFANLCKLRDDLVFMVVGGGPYLEDLKDLAKEKDLAGKVIFTDMVEPDQAIYYYSIADIFISASISESQGLTYIEALANGIPEVCRKDEALEGVLEDGYNGYSYETGDGFIKYTNMILDDENLRAKMSKNAKVSSQKFSIQAFGENAVEVYKEAIEDFQARPRIIPKTIYNLVKKI